LKAQNTPKVNCLEHVRALHFSGLNEQRIIGYQSNYNWLFKISLYIQLGLKKVVVLSIAW